MSLPAFLTALHENVRVRVTIVPDKTPDARAHAETKLRELDLLARAELAGDAPEFRPDAALWAATALHQACQFLIFREVSAETVRAALAVPCPETPSPAVCYSVDLSLRYLPDLLALARGAAEDDPLNVGLLALAKAWPLSSVGIKNLPPSDIAAFIAHPSLRRLYADRIIQFADRSRLDDPRVLEAVREGIGAFPELAPALAADLKTQEA